MEALFYSLVAVVVNTQCADTLVTQRDFFNVPCLLTALSKGLSYAIILGAVVVKVPQILKFVKSKSCAGVSLVSQLQELVASTFTLSYYIARQVDFSAWGEVFFITLQLVVIVCLMLSYDNKQSFIPAFLAVYGLVFYLTAFGPIAEFVVILFQLAIPIQSVSRVVQIYSTWSQGSTGQLSFVTSLMNLAGTSARVFSAFHQGLDSMVILSFCIFSVLNAIILLQFALYWNVSDDKSKPKTAKPKAKKMD